MQRVVDFVGDEAAPMSVGYFEEEDASVISGKWVTQETVVERDAAACISAVQRTFGNEISAHEHLGSGIDGPLDTTSHVVPQKDESSRSCPLSMSKVALMVPPAT